MAARGVEPPECPVCFELMSAPIFQCKSGHSLCATCTTSLIPAICPICREAMTQMRNRTLEDVIAKTFLLCPNMSNGCALKMKIQEVDKHLKQCFYREFTCPIGVGIEKCSWKGKVNDLMQHFHELHPENCNVNNDSDVELDKISVKEDDHRVYLVTEGKGLFMITVKIDTVQKMSYWLVQQIGCIQKNAQQYFYEIHITSKQDNKRKVAFHEYCLNDTMQPQEIFRQGKCGIVPLSMLCHFVQDKKLIFKFLIIRFGYNKNLDKDDGDDANPSSRRGPRGFKGGRTISRPRRCHRRPHNSP